MIQSGSRPNKINHLDHDFIKSSLFGAIPSFPQEFLTDYGGTIPNQNTDGQPFGCTNYAQARLSSSLTKGTDVKNPMSLEAVTHANALGGYDIRDSLQVARKILLWFTNFYNIRAGAGLDFFDSFRLAQIIGYPMELRSITWGTPWFPSWEAAINGNVIVKNPDGSYTTKVGARQTIMPMPTDAELSAIRKDSNAFSWHDSVLDGWTTWDGILIYRDASWQGDVIGRDGFVGFTRETINTVMALSGTVAFTGTNIPSNAPQTIDVTVFQWIISLIRNVFHA